MIVTTVVLTNAAQAKCFPLSMPITYECSYTSDLEPQLCLEPNGDQWNLELENLAAFAHFSAQKRVTSGDKLGERLEPAFDRKRANLEAQAPHLPSDAKKRTFRS